MPSSSSLLASANRFSCIQRTANLFRTLTLPGSSCKTRRQHVSAASVCPFRKQRSPRRSSATNDILRPHSGAFRVTIRVSRRANAMPEVHKSRRPKVPNRKLKVEGSKVKKLNMEFMVLIFLSPAQVFRTQADPPARYRRRMADKFSSFQRPVAYTQNRLLPLLPVHRSTMNQTAATVYCPRTSPRKNGIIFLYTDGPP